MKYLITSPSQLGKVLRGIRKQRDLTQAETATKADLFPKTISAFEHDPSDAAISTLFKLLSALRVEFTLDENPTVPRTEGDDW